MGSVSEHATAYVQAGLALVPIPRGKKGPTHRGWNKLKECITTNEQTATLNGYNIGLAHLHSRTCAIDIDDMDKASDWLKEQGLDLEHYLYASNAVKITRDTRPDEVRRSKLIYRLPEGIEALPTHMLPRSGIEFRCADKSLKTTVQDVLPPSIHPNGTPYRWDGDWQLLPKLPDELLELWSSLQNKPKIDSISIHNSEIIEGSRNVALTRIAGAMRRQGSSLESVTAALLAENRKSCNPPLPEGEVKGIARSVCRYDSEFEALDGKQRHTQEFILTHASDLKVTKPEFLIDKILEKNVLGLMFADPGVGKTFLAVSWALCIATGKKFLDQSVTQGAVIFIKGEGHGGFARRLSAWSIYHGIDLNESELFVSEQAANLYDMESALAVRDAVSAIADNLPKPPVLIIIDTLARNFGSGDENNTSDMNQFIDHIETYIRSRYNATVLLVHHTGHSEKKRARGASSLKAALDIEYKLERTGANLCSLACTKAKDMEPFPNLALELASVDLGLDDDEGLPVTSLVIRESDQPEVKPANTLRLGRNQILAKSILELLESDQGDKSILLFEWSRACKDQGLNKQAFNRIKNDLISRRLIALDTDSNEVHSLPKVINFT